MFGEKLKAENIQIMNELNRLININYRNSEFIQELEGENSHSIDLCTISGSDPYKFASNVMYYIYGEQISNYVLTKNGICSNSTRNIIPEEKVELVKNALKKKFKLSSKDLTNIWPKIRSVVNTRGRVKKFRMKKVL